jgi:hypothetical protein
MITLTHGEAQQVLDALADAAWCVQHNNLPPDDGHDWDKEIELLRARLAQPEPEPVDKVGSLYPDFWDWLPKAYGDVGDERAFTKYNMEVAFAAGAENEAKRMWLGLTDEERIQVLHSGDKEGYLEYAKGIEAKLKEKNI